MLGLLITTILLNFNLAGAAQPQKHYGGRCGLVDSFIESAWQPQSDLSYNQIMTFARAFPWDLNKESEAIPMRSLQANFNGFAYDLIVYYPGENPVGTIFRQGSNQIVAVVQDSDIICRTRSR